MTGENGYGSRCSKAIFSSNVVLDAYSHLNIVKAPAVLCFVRNSRGLSVPCYQIESLQTMINAAQPLTIHSYLKEGEMVQVARGPFAGCIGILDRLNAKRGRLVLNVNIFGKSISVELDIEDVELAATL